MSATTKSWLTLWCWAVILFGAVLVLGATAFARPLGTGLFAMLGRPDTAFDAPLEFALALMGAVTLGWGLTVLAVVRTGLADRKLWRGVALALLVWYLVDTAMSVATGFALNGVSNTVLLVAFLLIARPLLTGRENIAA